MCLPHLSQFWGLSLPAGPSGARFSRCGFLFSLFQWEAVSPSQRAFLGLACASRYHPVHWEPFIQATDQQMSPLWVCLEWLRMRKVISLWGGGSTARPPTWHVDSQAVQWLCQWTLAEWVTVENEDWILVWRGSVPCGHPQQIPQVVCDDFFSRPWSPPSPEGSPFSLASSLSVASGRSMNLFLRLLICLLISLKWTELCVYLQACTVQVIRHFRSF